MLKVRLDITYKIIYNKHMITEIDVKRSKDIKINKLDSLAKACAKANNDDFKNLWFSKLHDLGKQYGLMNYVRRLIH